MAKKARFKVGQKVTNAIGEGEVISVRRGDAWNMDHGGLDDYPVVALFRTEHVDRVLYCTRKGYYYNGSERHENDLVVPKKPKSKKVKR